MALVLLLLLLLLPYGTKTNYNCQYINSGFMWTPSSTVIPPTASKWIVTSSCILSVWSTDQYIVTTSAQTLFFFTFSFCLFAFNFFFYIYIYIYIVSFLFSSPNNLCHSLLYIIEIEYFCFKSYNILPPSHFFCPIWKVKLFKRTSFITLST